MVVIEKSLQSRIDGTVWGPARKPLSPGELRSHDSMSPRAKKKKVIRRPGMDEAGVPQERLCLGLPPHLHGRGGVRILPSSPRIKYYMDISRCTGRRWPNVSKWSEAFASRDGCFTGSSTTQPLSPRKR